MFEKPAILTFQYVYNILEHIYWCCEMMNVQKTVVKCDRELATILKVDYFVRNSIAYRNLLLPFFRPVTQSVQNVST
jgi:hypothetical protein